MKYKLYYWNAPFRGNFPRLCLEDQGIQYEELDPSEIYPDKRLDIQFPGMAPPFLFDKKHNKYLTQMPAITMYLGDTHGLLPKSKLERALSGKLLLDCNDILHEITNYNGLTMWKEGPWKEFRAERLPVWMRIFEKIGKENGLKKTGGFMFGEHISVADYAATALFGSMVYCLPELKEDLQEHAPKISALCERVEKRKKIKSFLEKQREEIGLLYCGGQIEKSIRKMLKG